ncbi:hypothetical protein [Paenibacillus favisporus]|uniref:hypothetical protein n=1 Tax=Paenibacillus favisporus TaxID=221028 RepID=UPI003D2D3875
MVQAGRAILSSREKNFFGFREGAPKDAFVILYPNPEGLCRKTSPLYGKFTDDRMKTLAIKRFQKKTRVF